MNKTLIEQLMLSLEGNLAVENRSFIQGFREEAEYISSELDDHETLTWFIKFVKAEAKLLSAEREEMKSLFRYHQLRSGGKPGVSARQFAFLKGKAAMAERLLAFFEEIEEELCLEGEGSAFFEESLEELLEEYFEEGLLYSTK